MLSEEREAERQQALQSYEVMDTAPEPAFEHLTDMVTQLIGVPVALVSLISADRQWFKSRRGIDFDETPRDIALCEHVVQEGRLIAVDDAREDERFAQSPLVTMEGGVRAYASAPLRTQDDHVIGTLCAIDNERVRAFSQHELDVLGTLADAVMAHMETRRAVRIAEEVSRAQAAFMSRVSHELRTPIAAMVGYAEMTAEELEGSPHAQAREDMGQIAQGGMHVVRLLDDLLDLAKIERGKLEIFERDVDVGELFEEISGGLRSLTAQRRNIIECEPGGVVARGDFLRIKQILINLVANANKFTSQGRITLRAARHEEGGVVLSVSDTGQGIPPDRLEVIFEAFSQVRDASSRESGVGLGLAICRELAQLMGGELSVESAPGEGSTFSLRLGAGGRGA